MTVRWLVVVVVASGACRPDTSGSTLTQCQKLSPAPAVTPPGWGGTVFTIVMENHSRHDILGNHHAPYINRLAKKNAVALGYHDPYVHPSEANYLWMVSGQNFGVLDDGDPESHHLDSTSHIADQLEAAGLTWKTYQESMGHPCGRVSHGRYAAKHDPFVFFTDVNGWDGSVFQRSQRCIDHVVDYSQLDTDIANNQLPRYVFITPNLDHDMHDGSIYEGDAWLTRELPKILATSAYQNGGAIFLLWDEGSGLPASDDPLLMLISPNAKAGLRSRVDYDTSSYLKTVQGLLGLPALPCGAATVPVPSMDDLLEVPITAANP
jgi:phospholipase C